MKILNVTLFIALAAFPGCVELISRKRNLGISYYHVGLYFKDRAGKVHQLPRSIRLFALGDTNCGWFTGYHVNILFNKAGHSIIQDKKHPATVIEVKPEWLKTNGIPGPSGAIVSDIQHLVKMTSEINQIKGMHGKGLISPSCPLNLDTSYHKEGPCYHQGLYYKDKGGIVHQLPRSIRLFTLVETNCGWHTDNDIYILYNNAGRSVIQDDKNPATIIEVEPKWLKTYRIPGPISRFVWNTRRLNKLTREVKQFKRMHERNNGPKKRPDTSQGSSSQGSTQWSSNKRPRYV